MIYVDDRREHIEVFCRLHSWSSFLGCYSKNLRGSRMRVLTPSPRSSVTNTSVKITACGMLLYKPVHFCICSLFTLCPLCLYIILRVARLTTDQCAFSCLIGCCEVILFVLLPPTPISRPPFASLCTAWLTLHQTVPKHFR